MGGRAPTSGRSPYVFPLSSPPTLPSLSSSPRPYPHPLTHATALQVNLETGKVRLVTTTYHPAAIDIVTLTPLLRSYRPPAPPAPEEPWAWPALPSVTLPALPPPPPFQSVAESLGFPVCYAMCLRVRVLLRAHARLLPVHVPVPVPVTVTVTVPVRMPVRVRVHVDVRVRACMHVACAYVEGTY